MTAKPTTIDQYLDRVLPEQRVVLEKLRATIKAAAPGAEEGISYQLAAFRLGGKPLIAFGATARHCALYPMSAATVEAFAGELAAYETSKGTIRFQPEKPLPAALVRKLVKARIAELNSGAAPAMKATTPAPTARPTKAAPRAKAARPVAATRPAEHDDPAAVNALLAKLAHPLDAAIGALRAIIAGADKRITQGVKWNSPSFYFNGWFATINTRSKTELLVIFHQGARATHRSAPTIDDPTGLLKWLGKDRCAVAIAGPDDAKRKRAALVAIVRQWIALMPDANG